MLNPRKLEHFVAVVRAGSLSRAADMLDMAQPALSRDIKDLETELGLPLLRRHARGVVPTEAGKIFVQRAQAILDMLEAVHDEVRTAAEEPSGRLAFGMPVSMAALLTGPLVAQFREAYPKVRLHVREAMSSELHEALRRRDVDVAVLAAPVADPQVSTLPLLSEPMVLVGPATSRLSPRRPVSLENVGSHPLILPAPPHSARFMVEAALANVGLQPDIAIEADIAPLSYFVSRGLGYSVVPWCATHNVGMVTASMKFAPIRDMRIAWVVARSASAAHSLASDKLVEMIAGMVDTLIRDGTWKAVRTVS